MQLYEQDEKGLFTFYREQDEFQQNLKKRLMDRQISKLQDLSNFKGQVERSNVMKKRKLKKQNTQPRLSHNIVSKKIDENTETKDYDRCPDTIAHIEKSKLNRNHKLLKMSLKKTESDDENGRDLKNHLKQLLKTEESDLEQFEQTKVEHTNKQTLKESLESKNKLLCQLLNSNDVCQQGGLKVGKPEAKLGILSRSPKQPIHQLKNIVFPKSFQQVKQKFSQKFPRINKKSLSQKLRHLNKADTTLFNLNAVLNTRYLSPTRKIQQQYLEPICTQRKKRVSYALNIEYFNPNRSSSKKSLNNQTVLALLPNESQKGNEEALRNMAKNIKFK